MMNSLDDQDNGLFASRFIVEAWMTYKKRRKENTKIELRN